MSLLSHQGLLLDSAEMTLSDFILSKSPFFYCRHAEPSGTVMENETSLDGTYIGTTISLAQAALYTGGPTSVFFDAGSSPGGNLAASIAPASSLPALTLMTIVSKASFASTPMIIARDADSGVRCWQWRFNNTNMEWIKTVTSVQTVAKAHGMSVNVAAIVAVTVSAAGVVSMYVNGSLLTSTGSVTAANYGSDTRDIRINIRGTGTSTDGRYSESCGFATDLSPTDILTAAQLAGFA